MNEAAIRATRYRRLVPRLERFADSHRASIRTAGSDIFHLPCHRHKYYKRKRRDGDKTGLCWEPCFIRGSSAARLKVRILRADHAGRGFPLWRFRAPWETLKNMDAMEREPTSPRSLSTQMWYSTTAWFPPRRGGGGTILRRVREKRKEKEKRRSRELRCDMVDKSIGNDGKSFGMSLTSRMSRCLSTNLIRMISQRRLASAIVHPKLVISFAGSIFHVKMLAGLHGGDMLNGSAGSISLT